jgi:hypothetical protein
LAHALAAKAGLLLLFPCRLTWLFGLKSGIRRYFYPSGSDPLGHRRSFAGRHHGSRLCRETPEKIAGVIFLLPIRVRKNSRHPTFQCFLATAAPTPDHGGRVGCIQGSVSRVHTVVEIIAGIMPVLAGMGSRMATTPLPLLCNSNQTRFYRRFDQFLKRLKSSKIAFILGESYAPSTRIRNRKMVNYGNPRLIFQLLDTQDAIIKLSDFKGKKHVVLVLSRSFFVLFAAGNWLN